jgi:hypothetical protein
VAENVALRPAPGRPVTLCFFLGSERNRPTPGLTRCVTSRSPMTPPSIISTLPTPTNGTAGAALRRDFVLVAAIPAIPRGVRPRLQPHAHQPAPLVFVFTRRSMLFAVM